LADTALALIDDYGLAQVTHRAIDAAAGVPIGTTSNYFPTRAALRAGAPRGLLRAGTDITTGVSHIPAATGAGR
ncbi:TetR family transcriptional regulator, partial [Nocardia cyriacigeorgica]|uniref:TetR family transcriptional regulator n=1 Tax=Nocardia cyriacigeorgica TaxID=135487 RepID=UPI0024561BDE